MDTDNRGFDGDNSFRLRLPVIIPRLDPVRRFTLPHRGLMLVAALSVAVGVLTAALWRGNPGVTVSPSRTAGESAGPALTRIRLSAPPAAGFESAACQATFRAPQLVMSTQQPTLLPAGEPASLGLTTDAAPAGAQLIVCGFAPTSVISAGHSIDDRTWILPVSELTYASLVPPRGYIGLMRLGVVLANPDQSIADRRTLNLQWLPPTPATPQPAEVAEANPHLEEGKRLKAAGNLPLARGIFMRYAKEDARAAFLLAETYDPISLSRRQLLPPDSDIAAARLWYRRASELGLRDANVRLERLASWTW